MCIFEDKVREALDQIESGVIISWDSADLNFLEAHLATHEACAVSVQSSGTTGEASERRHLIGTLWEKIPSDNRTLCWFSSFPRSSMGFMQVFLHAMKNGHEISPRISTSVNALSITPSYLRRTISGAGLAPNNLQQLTLGGEHASQHLLDMASRVFPKARITHTYASSEFGQVFSASDKLEGFPKSQISRRRGFYIDRVSGELMFISSEGERLHSGDLFTIAGDRIKFLSRTNNSGNVGGALVFPNLVAEFLRELPEVREARCFLSPNSLLGNVVECEVVTFPGQLWDATGDVTAQIVERFGRAYRPATVSVVEDLPLRESSKAQ